MNVCFEFGAIFHSFIRWGKQGGKFKINIHLNSVEWFLYCLCSSRCKHSNICENSTFQYLRYMEWENMRKFWTRIWIIFGFFNKHVWTNILYCWISGSVINRLCLGKMPSSRNINHTPTKWTKLVWNVKIDLGKMHFIVPCNFWK